MRACPRIVAASTLAENLLRIIYKEQIPTLSNRVKEDRNDVNSTFLNSKAFYCYDIGTSGSTIADCEMRIADLRLHKTELGKVEGGSYYWILVLLK